MSEFNVSAELEFDESKALNDARELAKKLNNTFAKAIKPIVLKVDDKNLKKFNTILGDTEKKLAATDKALGAVSKTAKTFEKDVSALSKGVASATQAFDKASAPVTRFGNSIRSVLSNSLTQVRSFTASARSALANTFTGISSAPFIQSINRGFNQALSGLARFGNTFRQRFGQIFSNLTPTFRGLTNSFSRAFQDIAARATGLGRSIGTALSSGLSNVGSSLSSLGDRILTPVRTALGRVTALASSTASGIATNLNRAFGVIGAGVSGVVDAASGVGRSLSGLAAGGGLAAALGVGAALDGLDKLRLKTQDLDLGGIGPAGFTPREFKESLKFFDRLIFSSKEAGAAIARNLRFGFNNVFGALAGVASGAFNKVKGVFKSFNPVFEALGSDFRAVFGLEQGILGDVKKFFTGFKPVFQALGEDFRAVFGLKEGIFGDLQRQAAKAVTKVQGLFSRGLNFAKTLVDPFGLLPTYATNAVARVKAIFAGGFGSSFQTLVDPFGLLPVYATKAVAKVGAIFAAAKNLGVGLFNGLLTGAANAVRFVGRSLGKVASVVKLSFQAAGVPLSNFGNKIQQSLTPASEAVGRFATRLKVDLEEGKKSLDRFAQSAGQMAKRVALGAGVAAGALAVFGVKATADLQTLRVSLEGLTGSSEAGAKAFKRITEFAAETPFTVDAVTTAVVQLSAAMGLNTEQSLSFLTTLGNAGAAAGASSAQIELATRALTQISAAGRLTAQDLNQVTSAIPSISRIKVFEELAATMGKTVPEVQALAEQGLIPSAEAINAVLAVAEKVPGAMGAMERQSKTLNGVFSTLSDNVKLVAFGALEPLAKAFGEFATSKEFSEQLKGLTDDAKAFGQSLATGIQSGIAQLRPVLAQIGPNIKDVFGNIVDVFKGFGGAIPGIVSALGPLTAILATLTSLAADFAAAFGPAIGAAAAALGGILSVVSPLLNILKPLSPIITGIVAGFATLAIASKAAAAATLVLNGVIAAMNLILAANPIVLAAAAIVAIGVAAFAAYKKFEPFRNVVDAIGRVIKGTLLGAFNALKTAFNTVVSVGKNILGFFAKFRGLLLVIAAPLAVPIGLIYALVKAGQFLVKNFGAIKDAVVGAFLKFTPLGQIITLISKNFGKFVDILKTVRSFLADKLGSAISFVVEKAKSFVGAFANLPGVQGVINGLSSALDFLNRTFDRVVKDVIKLLNKLPGVNIKVDTKKAKQDIEDVQKKAAEQPAFRLPTKNPLAGVGADAFSEMLDPINALIDAQQALEDATKSRQKAELDAARKIADINKQETKLRQERNRIDRNGLGIADERAESAQRLLDIEEQLRDLAQQREQLDRDEQRRQEDFAIAEREFGEAEFDRARELEKAKRALIEAENELNGVKDVGQSLDLTGLTLDQTKTLLARTRETLKAQKQGNVASADRLDKEEAVVDARIAVREAEQAQADAQVERRRFLEDQAVAQREYHEDVANLNQEVAQANRDQIKAAEEHSALLRGEIGIAAQLRDIDEQLADFERQRAEAGEAAAEARKAEADAYRKVAIESEKVKNNQLGLNAALLADLEARRARLTTESAITAEIDKQIAKARNAAGLSAEAFSASIKLVEQRIANGAEPNPLVQGLKRAFDLLPEELKNQFRPIIELLLQAFKPNRNGIRAFAEGGVITKRIDNATLGEGNRPEVVLPLTKPARMQSLLANKLVQGPVLAAMERMNILAPAQNTAINQPQASINVAAPSVDLRQPKPVSKQDQDKQNRALAKAIATELIAAGVGAGGDTIHHNNEIRVEDSTGNTQVLAREVLRRLRNLEGDKPI